MTAQDNLWQTTFTAVGVLGYTSPADQESEVELERAITAYFDTRMDTSTLNGPLGFKMTEVGSYALDLRAYGRVLTYAQVGSGLEVSGSVSWAGGDKVFTYTPSAALEDTTSYQLSFRTGICTFVEPGTGATPECLEGNITNTFSTIVIPPRVSCAIVNALRSQVVCTHVDCLG